MYVLSTEADSKTYYWLGKGQFTTRLKWAKQYPTWEAANAIANRVKRWRLKFSSIEEEAGWCQEK